jgi:hypothetical protein
MNYIMRAFKMLDDSLARPAFGRFDFILFGSQADSFLGIGSEPSCKDIDLYLRYRSQMPIVYRQLNEKFDIRKKILWTFKLSEGTIFETADSETASSIEKGSNLIERKEWGLEIWFDKTTMVDLFSVLPSGFIMPIPGRVIYNGKNIRVYVTALEGRLISILPTHKHYSSFVAGLRRANRGKLFALAMKHGLLSRLQYNLAEIKIYPRLKGEEKERYIDELSGWYWNEMRGKIPVPNERFRHLLTK